MNDLEGPGRPSSAERMGNELAVVIHAITELDDGRVAWCAPSGRAHDARIWCHRFDGSTATSGRRQRPDRADHTRSRTSRRNQAKLLRIADDNSVAGDTQRRQTRQQQHLQASSFDHPIRRVPIQVISDRVARRRHDPGRQKKKRSRFGMYLSPRSGTTASAWRIAPGEDRIEDTPRPTPIRCTLASSTPLYLRRAVSRWRRPERVPPRAPDRTASGWLIERRHPSGPGLWGPKVQ